MSVVQFFLQTTCEIQIEWNGKRVLEIDIGFFKKVNKFTDLKDSLFLFYFKQHNFFINPNYTFETSEMVPSKSYVAHISTVGWTPTLLFPS